jgi:hypothetical protein
MLFLISCSKNENLEKTIGTALIDGVTEDGIKYNVNVWAGRDPNRGKMVASLTPNTPISIISISIIDEIPWFGIRTEFGEMGYVNILHLKNIEINEDELNKVNIDYNRIQYLGMLSPIIILDIKEMNWRWKYWDYKKVKEWYYFVTLIL